jgi:hypothetical protein
MLRTIEKILIGAPSVRKEVELLELGQRPPSSSSAATDDLPNAKSLSAHDSPVLSDLDRAFVAADEESDWPEFLPAERIKPGPFDFALGTLLFADLVALGGLFFFYFAS